MDKEKVSSNGAGIGTILFLIFLVLKLAGIGQVANWSWWWVTAPLWLPIVAVLITVLIIGIFAVIIKLIND